MFNLEKMRKEALTEIERASQNISVWLIMKDGKFRGKITLRWAKNVAYTAFFMYALEDRIAPIGATATMHGCGYNKFGCCISKIFGKLRTPLSVYFGVNFECSTWDIMNKWQYFFEKAGYTILKAL